MPLIVVIDDRPEKRRQLLSLAASIAASVSVEGFATLGTAIESAASAPPRQREGGVPVAFSSDGNLLASGSLSGVIRLWRPGDLSAPVASLFPGGAFNCQGDPHADQRQSQRSHDSPFSQAFFTH